MRLIDAEALPITALIKEGHWAKEVVYKADIDAAPTVDAVEVIRCRDCKHWTTEGNGYMDNDPHCGNPDGIDGYTNDDDFCSYGERKEG